VTTPTTAEVATMATLAQRHADDIRRAGQILRNTGTTGAVSAPPRALLERAG
jgi:hypothetical protein